MPSISSQTPPRLEEPLQALAIRLLENPNGLADRAWGASMCGGMLFRECTPALLRELDRARVMADAREDGEEFYYVQALFDALIRLRAEVPPNLLQPFDPRWRTEVIVLLAAGSHATETFLLQLERQDLTEAEWITVSNVLLRLHSREFLRRMVQQTRFVHFVAVYDGEGPEIGIGGGIGDSPPPARTVRRVPAGFPPVGVYELHAGARGAMPWLLTLGPCAGGGWSNGGGGSTVSRIEITAAGTEADVPPPRHPASKTNQCRVAYLAAYQGITTEAADAIVRASTRIWWVAAARFAEVARAAIEKQAWDLRSFLLQAGLRQEDGLTLTIQVHVTDVRRNRHTPLPQLPSRQVRLD